MVNNNANQREMKKMSLLAEIASLYYEHDLTQAEIAHKMSISRTQVSRLLKQAKEKGLVQIIINYNGQRHYELERLLAARFDLKEARVFNSQYRSYDEILQGIGSLAAEYLQSQLRSGVVLGITWGRTVFHTINALQPHQKLSIDLVQVIGAAAVGNPFIDSTELMGKAAHLLGGRTHYLNAPLYIEDDYVRSALMNEPMIRHTINLARRADVILTGIGALSPQTYLWPSFLDEKMLDGLRREGAVGSACAQFFDRWGNAPPGIMKTMNGRIMGISLSDLKNVKTAIGVAGGVEKAEAILAALRGGLINTLVTDSQAANEVLIMADSAAGPQETPVESPVLSTD